MLKVTNLKHPNVVIHRNNHNNNKNNNTNNTPGSTPLLSSGQPVSVCMCVMCQWKIQYRVKHVLQALPGTTLATPGQMVLVNMTTPLSLSTSTILSWSPALTNRGEGAVGEGEDGGKVPHLLSGGRGMRGDSYYRYKVDLCPLRHTNAWLVISSKIVCSE